MFSCTLDGRLTHVVQAGLNTVHPACHAPMHTCFIVLGDGVHVSPHMLACWVQDKGGEAAGQVQGQALRARDAVWGGQAQVKEDTQQKKGRGPFGVFGRG